MISRKATVDDAESLAELRARAMKPSLEDVGRYDEVRVRSRFLDSFEPEDTTMMYVGDVQIGFYVLLNKGNYLLLDHLYVDVQYQNAGYGSRVIEAAKAQATHLKLPLRVGALRGSQSNEFYARHGFVKMGEDEFDIYYEFAVEPKDP